MQQVFPSVARLGAALSGGALSRVALFGVAVSGLAFCATTPAAAQTSAVEAEPELARDALAERRATFRSWRAACSLTGSCLASTFNGSPTASRADADFVLSVASAAPGLDRRVIFTGIAAEADLDSDITVLVDGAWVATLSAADNLGWAFEPDLGVNDYVFAQSVANLEILPALTNGARAVIAFRDWQGARRKIPFSLIGLTAALEWMDQQGPPARSAPASHAPQLEQ